MEDIIKVLGEFLLLIERFGWFNVLAILFLVLLYKKGTPLISDVGLDVKKYIQKRTLVTEKELLDHSLFKILNFSELDNTFKQITKDSPKNDFKFYVANTICYITQYHHNHNYKEFVKNAFKMSSDEFDRALTETINKTDNDILNSIKENFGEKLLHVYEKNTLVTRNFYNSLILNISEYEQFGKNEKIYSVLNNLMFLTKTNEQSLFQMFLKMNGELEILQETMSMPTKLKLILNQKQ